LSRWPLPPAEPRLKLGTSVLVLPGRNPVVLAKELASLDRLSGGRLLLAVGLGASDAREHQAFGIGGRDRAPWMDEVMPLLRRLWTEENVTHSGPRFHFEDLTVLPRPIQQPIDIWLGGLAPAALRRLGRIGDGWLPSTITPPEAAKGRAIIQESAAAADRVVDPEHFGAMVVYARGAIPPALAKTLATRRPEVDPADLVPVGPSAIRDTIGAFTEAGISKFVLRPAEEPENWDAELEELAPLVQELST